MISIKHSIDVLGSEERERVLAAACAKIVTALERTATVLAGESGQRFRDRLAAARVQFAPQTDPSLVEQGGTEVAQELDEFTSELTTMIGTKDSQYKEVVRLVAEAATTLAENGAGQSQELKTFATKIEAASHLGNIAEIKKQLTQRVTELKTIAERIQRDGQERAAALEHQVQSVTAQLKRVETLAETDALTGLGNRRHADQTMHAAIVAGTPFCLFVFDLNGFKPINDLYGHAQGDQLLKAVARGLKNAVRGNDTVCRWGGDEFIIIMVNTTLAEAKQRLPRVQASTFGEFALDHNGTTIRVNVTAGVGIAEYQPGETITAFFERADQLLYQQKRPRRT